MSLLRVRTFSPTFMTVFTFLRIVGRTNRENKVHERVATFAQQDAKINRRKYLFETPVKFHSFWVLNDCLLIVVIPLHPRKGENSKVEKCF